MDFAKVWRRLSPDTREWLAEHNGEPLTSEIVTEIVALNGNARPFWIVDSSDGPSLADDAVDWVEAAANGE
jgi:hypothetical protein